jgi:replicative DNA helicase
MNDPKPLPHDLDVEFALIGWILSNNRVMSVTGDLRADDFHSAPHADIYQAIEKLSRSGDDITPFTIAPLLERPDAYDDLGGFNKYIVGSFSHSLVYPLPASLAKHIVKLAKERRFIEACQNAVDMPLSEAALAVTRAANQATTSTSRTAMRTSREVACKIVDDMKTDVIPTSTGLRKLDEAMGGGLFTGKSYGFAARKKVGKTSAAATISHNLDMAGVKHLFICGEMSAEEIHQRVMARQTASYTSAFRSDYRNTLQFQEKLARTALNSAGNALYCDAPGLTFDELIAIVSNAHEQHKIDGFILDYWQLVGGKPKTKSTAEHLDEVAQWIADTSRKMGVWSITMAQINQEGNTRGGEGIRLAFDQLYQLHREDLGHPHAWLEMMETRYTPWTNIGDKDRPGLIMMEHGQYFEEI